MQLAIAITLLFVAATSLLGARRSGSLAMATGQRTYWLGACVAIGMAAWLAYCAIWMFEHRL